METIVIFNGGSEHPRNEGVSPRLLEIADEWRKLSAETGDIGCCVIGAEMAFEFDGKEYEMMPQSPWQGEGSWTKHKDYIMQKLKDIGAINVKYEWGRMD